ncbi:MAG: helix-turn-helix domain-containing protein [Clostridia bacterium]|nr:helix-turn-helix domain-containing protein [Clostridia bacterium]
MQNNNVTLISPHQFYEEINRTLNTPIGIHKVYDLVKRKDFPSVRIGRKFYIIQEEIKNWLEKQTGMRKN